MRKRTKWLLFLAFLFLAIDILWLEDLLLVKDKNIVFFESVSFGGFHTTYCREFEVKHDSYLQIGASADIEEGNVYFCIYSSDGEMIFEIEGDVFSEQKQIPIHEGVWEYYFECCAERGAINEYALNGEYEFEIRVIN